MSSCAFASYLSMRQSRPSSSGGTAASTSVAIVAAFASSSISPFDAHDTGSPHKRQRNTSPDYSAALRLGGAEIPSYFAWPAPPVAAPTPTHSSSSTHCVPRSILCTPSSPPSTSPSSPYTSPPCSRPLSRRSSTSKSVRFARCTNASVFPTHSTYEYDRSPIIPTGESESLEIKRNNDDDDGGWVQCHVREKKEGEQARCSPQLPKHSPAMENPVEGVHGLIEGGFFVGDSAERDGAHPALEAADVIPEDNEPLEFEDEGMVVDDSTESASDEAHMAPVPSLIRTGSLSEEDESSSSAAEDIPPPSSPDLSEYDAHAPRIRRGSVSSDGDEPMEEKERKRAECRKKFGLCAMGKWSRSDLFQSHDSLGGF
ncbi:hypothetical protein JCM11641_000946 [Rhodosporidiobolus odoratus]